MGVIIKCFSIYIHMFDIIYRFLKEYLHMGFLSTYNFLVAEIVRYQLPNTSLFLENGVMLSE